MLAGSLHGRRQSGTCEKSNTDCSFDVPRVNASLDHVIVGGGTAGFLISVAVITAGGFYEADRGNISVVPAYDVFYSGTDANDK